MRITISGCHCAGKTTLLKSLSELEEFSDWIFLPGPTRWVKAQGFDINELGGDETQLLCMSVDIQNLLLQKSENIISDRCLLDTYIYTLYLYLKNQISEEVMNITKLTWERYKSSYDLIIMPSHFEVPLEDDGERSVNLEFRDTIYRLFLEEINRNIGTLSCFIVGGTNDQRINTIKQILGK